MRPDSYKPFKWLALFIRLVPSRKIAWLSVIYRDGQNKFSDCTEIIFWYDLSPSTFRIFPSLPQWTLWEMGKGLVRIIKKINPYDTYNIPWAKIFWIRFSNWKCWGLQTFKLKIFKVISGLQKILVQWWKLFPHRWPLCGRTHKFWL